MVVVFTLLSKVIVLIPISLLSSDDYRIRSLSYETISVISPWTYVTPVLEQSYSCSKDLNSRRLLSMLIESSCDYSGEWHVTKLNGEYSGGGVLSLWDNGHGEYRCASQYSRDNPITMDFRWRVYGRILVLNYGSFKEVYAPSPPPKDSSWRLNDLSIRNGLPTRANRSFGLRLYGLTINGGEE